jgi:hypothetical protein
MNKGWVQFLLVAVPVLSLVGAWLALRALGSDRTGADRGRREAGRHGKDEP